MAGLNGNTKWVIGVLGFFILAGSTVAAVTIAVAGKADYKTVQKNCSRLAAVETELDEREKQLDRIERHLEEIERLLREGAGK